MKLTATHGVIAMKGSGKTYGSMAIAESMLDAGGQIVAIDPTGAWWGLRLNADGKGVRYPHLLVLGANGSLPLSDSMGEAVARLVVGQRISVVLDLSEMSKAGMRRFVAAFLLELYRTNPNRQLHTFVDEADLFAPERGMGEAAKCMGAMSDYFRRGRRKGLGGTIITQRVQAVSKDVLWQCEAMTLLRLKGTHDIKAIKDWLDSNGYDAKTIAAKLPKLKRGECYVCDGEVSAYHQAGQQVRNTYDSSRTPEVGDERFAPPALDAAALAEIKKGLGEAAAELEANDPKALKKRIKELEAQAARQTAATHETVEVKIPIVGEDESRSLSLLTSALTVYAERADELRAVLEGCKERVDEFIADVHKRIAEHFKDSPMVVYPKFRLGDAQAGDDQLGSENRLSEPRAGNRTEPRPVAASAQPVLPKGETAVLTALAQHGVCDRAQLSLLTGYRRSSRDAYIQRLVGKGYAHIQGGEVRPTREGVAALGSHEKLPSGEKLREWWHERLPVGEAAVLTRVCAEWPGTISRQELSEHTGYKRSSRDAYIQRLKARHLVVVQSDGVKASDSLF